MNYIGKIDTQTYSCIAPSLVTDDVIITDERIGHIQSRHPGHFELIFPYFQEALQHPDYILEDSGKSGSCLILKWIRDKDIRFQMVLRVLASNDNPIFKNSIISAWRISESRWNNYLRSRKVLYKHSDV